MSDHPLGTPNTADTPTDPVVKQPSIVDTILDLDALLSADVRRAEKTARFATKPWLEADIEDLNTELDMLTDDTGKPLAAVIDPSLGDGPVRDARTVALELQAVQREYGESFRSVRVQQLPADDWTAFQAKHKKDIEAGAPFPPKVFDELIVATAKTPTISAEQIRKMRKQLGHPQINEIALAAWSVNASSGVSIPKSQLSSVVLRRTAPERS